ncbi:MAG: hypothetical protein JWL77_4566 [Chthonomonadaceae bacterium]|nr:hypothetical protein [Chthonomonadaceae bacterium]
MWILSQTNRLINMEKIESIDLASRRETTAGTVAYELLARTAAVGTGQPHLLARLESEAPGLQLIEELKQAIVSNTALFDIPAALQRIG